MRRLFSHACLWAGAVLLAGPAWSQTAAPVEAASPQLLEHIYQQIEKRERANQIPGLSSSANAALASSSLMDFIATRNQVRQLGPKAHPLAPRIAELLVRTEKNQYDLAWMLFEVTPPEDDSQTNASSALARYRSENGAGKLVQLARLGRIRSPLVVPDLQAAAADASPTTRLMAIIGLAFAGATSPDSSATSLGNALSDAEKYNRTAAANSIRLLGNRATAAVPALITYLKTRDNVFQAAAAMSLMPLSAIRPAKPELEAILGDSKLSEFQKRDVMNMLVRMETEK
ncbi:MAG: hypothetical protein C0428_10130 [Polaromonas sp.]|nr:hypothetical protein [Polaromonas sp.]